MKWGECPGCGKRVGVSKYKHRKTGEPITTYSDPKPKNKHELAIERKMGFSMGVWLPHECGRVFDLASGKFKKETA